MPPGSSGGNVTRKKLLESVQTRSFVAVVGPSGSGKSSVVFAGLLPKLRALGDWACVDFRPGAYPFESLALALLPLLEPQMSETSRMLEMRTLAAALQSGDICLDDVMGRVLQKCAPACRLLLIADQFEELYTLCPDPETRLRFVECLLSITQPVHSSGSSGQALQPAALVTLRADFLGQALAQRSFADALQDAQQLIGPMNADELRQAIEQPASVRGVRFEAGLVERILADLASQPGALPLLEFALTLLWQRQEAGRLTHAAYDAIGCVEGALAHYADQVLKRLNADEQQAAQRVFTQLVQPGSGTEDTRRLARRAELPPAQWELVKRLADARLVVTDQTAEGEEAAEVVHEALIQRWGQLRQWMGADRAFRNWQERLRASLGQWQQSQKDIGALLRGAPLAEAEGWLESRPATLGEAENAYIVASLQARRKEQVASRVRWGGISAMISLAVLITTLGATGNLSRFLYHPLPMKMVMIPAGVFWIGCDQENSAESCYDNELPRHKVYLDAYRIGVYEVTNRQYAQCVRARECAIPGNSRYLLDEYADHPVTDVSWHDAEAFCAWNGDRLSTEAEWEKAARGELDGRRYPWGDEIDCQKANYNGQDGSCVGDTTRVGSYAPNGYGLYDMAGNVWEWVNDRYDHDHGYYQNSLAENPTGPVEGTARMLRGGSWDIDDSYVRVAVRYGIFPTYRGDGVGFRCVADVPGE